jgi:hypothetical protein
LVCCFGVVVGFSGTVGAAAAANGDDETPSSSLLILTSATRHTAAYAAPMP